MDKETIVYTIPAPDSSVSSATFIEVYGDPENGGYEWRIVEGGGRVVRDTGAEERRQYGQAEIALRDALMVSSGLEDPHEIEMRRLEEDNDCAP